MAVRIASFKAERLKIPGIESAFLPVLMIEASTYLSTSKLLYSAIQHHAPPLQQLPYPFFNCTFRYSSSSVWCPPRSPFYLWYSWSLRLPSLVTSPTQNSLQRLLPTPTLASTLEEFIILDPSPPPALLTGLPDLIHSQTRGKLVAFVMLSFNTSTRFIEKAWDVGLSYREL